MIPRLLERYRKQIIPQLMKEFNITNPMAVPRLEKIVVNMGVGEALQDIKILDKAMEELSLITGQKPVICRAKKAISNFKIKAGNPIGCKVTLRRYRMYEFLDRLISVALPRIRDFRGVPFNSFDRAGNYALGISEQTIFPEINPDQVTRTQGMDVIFVIKNSKSAEQSRALLRAFGMPFREKE
ncbi:MAG: 50S ribosomal protein L5 [Candidatus Omnitrophica bacterium]|nr:50S ribosomal protein L5 [Candidatus Omnitrophota bacterium]